jgi:hypothetical protein
MAQLTSTGITFSDSSVQSSTGLPVAGGTFSGMPTLTHLVSGNGQAIIRQYNHSWTYASTAGGTVDLMYNTGSYSDIHFILFLHTSTGSNGFYIWEGIFGGYGAQYTQRAQTGNGQFNLTRTETSTGFAKISITTSGTLPSIGGTQYAMALITNTEGVAALNGTFYP